LPQVTALKDESGNLVLVELVSAGESQGEQIVFIRTPKKTPHEKHWEEEENE